jgi:excisionase family DNA binding protein
MRTDGTFQVTRKIGAVGPAQTPLTVAPILRSSDSPEFFTQKEAAAYMRTTYWAIREACYTGDLPYAKVGKRFIIHIADLRVWFEKQKRN